MLYSHDRIRTRRVLGMLSAVLLVAAVTASPAKAQIYRWDNGQTLSLKSPAPGVDLWSYDLAYADLAGAVMTGGTLESASLSQAHLAGANLTGVSFEHADLPLADLSGADLTNTSFLLADVTSADFSGATVRGAFISGYGDGWTFSQLTSTQSWADRDLSGVMLRGMNLGGQDLSGMDLSNFQYQGDLISTNLSGASLAGANLEVVGLTGSDLSGADLTGASLYRAELSGVDLTGATIRGLDFYRATGLTQAQLQSTQSWVDRDFSGAIFREQNLSGMDLSNMDLTDTDLRRAGLGGADLSGATIRGADLGYAGLSAGQLRTTQSWIDGDLRDVRLSNIRLSWHDLSGMDLRGAVFGEVTGSDFTGADIRGAAFSSSFGISLAQLASTQSWADHDLSGVGLREMDLSGVDLSNMNLADADLRNSDLTSADLTGAVLKGVRLAGTEGLTQAQFQSTHSWATGDFAGLRMESQDLSGWDLSGLDLTGAKLRWSDLSLADLSGANLTEAWLGDAQLDGANLSGADLTNVTLDVDLSTTDLSGAIILGADLSHADGLTAAKVQATQSWLSGEMSGVELPFGLDLAGVDLSGIDFSDADLLGVNINGADFTGAIIRGVRMPDTDFTPQQLMSTQSWADRDLRGLQFQDSGMDLSGQDLSGMDLRDSVLGNVDLSGADLTDVDWEGTLIYNVNFARADLRGTFHDFPYHPIWPGHTSSAILHDGRIEGWSLAPGESMTIRDYDGGIPILVEGAMVFAPGSTLVTAFEDPTWGSTISFAPGTPIFMGGALDLGFADGVDWHDLIGTTFDMFDWTGVTPAGAFTEIETHGRRWDTSGLYVTGDVTLLADLLEIMLDVKPGSEDNPVNLKSNGKLPVVIYGSEALDVLDVDVASLALAGVLPAPKGHSGKTASFDDVDGDGFLDIVLHFDVQALGIVPGMTELTLAGLLADGTELLGSDGILIVPDFNGDLAVNATDLVILEAAFGSSASWAQGDANGDGIANAADLAALKYFFGSAEPAQTAVPEPMTMAFLVVGAAAMLKRRR